MFIIALNIYSIALDMLMNLVLSSFFYITSYGELLFRNEVEKKRMFSVTSARVLFSILGCVMLGTLIYTLVTDGSPFRKELFTPWVFFPIILFVFEKGNKSCYCTSCFTAISSSWMLDEFLLLMVHSRFAWLLCDSLWLYTYLLKNIISSILVSNWPRT